MFLLQCTMVLSPLNDGICPSAAISQGNNCFWSKYFEYYFHLWFIIGDKLNSGNHSSGVNRTFNRNVERCVLNIWDELNVMWACGSCEWKYLGDICTMKGATVKKVILKSFQEQGLIGLCTKFQLRQSPPSSFSSIITTLLTNICPKYSPSIFVHFFTCPK